MNPAAFFDCTAFMNAPLQKFITTVRPTREKFITRMTASSPRADQRSSDEKYGADRNQMFRRKRPSLRISGQSLRQMQPGPHGA